MKKINLTKEELIKITKLDPTGKLIKAICFYVFDRKMAEINKNKPIYVVAIKSTKTCPALYVQLNDLEKFNKYNIK